MCRWGRWEASLKKSPVKQRMWGEDKLPSLRFRVKTRVSADFYFYFQKEARTKVNSLLLCWSIQTVSNSPCHTTATRNTHNKESKQPLTNTPEAVCTATDLVNVTQINMLRKFRYSFKICIYSHTYTPTDGDNNSVACKRSLGTSN